MEFSPTAADKLENCLNLVRELPKIAADDPRISDTEGRYRNIQFGNNFYLLWLTISPDSHADAIISEVYTKKLAELEEWNTFLEDNAELTSNIFTALKEVYVPYQTVFHQFLEFLSDRNWDAIDAIKETSEHPLGLEACNIYVWDKLNPLLEQAAESMSEYGIDVKELYL